NSRAEGFNLLLPRVPCPPLFLPALFPRTICLLFLLLRGCPLRVESVRSFTVVVVVVWSFLVHTVRFAARGASCSSLEIRAVFLFCSFFFLFSFSFFCSFLFFFVFFFFFFFFFVVFVCGVGFCFFLGFGVFFFFFFFFFFFSFFFIPFFFSAFSHFSFRGACW